MLSRGRFSVDISGLLTGGALQLPEGVSLKAVFGGLSLTFPVGTASVTLSFLQGGYDLGYLIPGGDFCLSREVGEYKLRYGACFPLPFFGIFARNIGVTLISENGTDKSFILKKDEAGVEVTFIFDESELTPELFIATHVCDFHASVNAYKESYKRRKRLTRAELFKSKFHLKRYALHKAHFENNIYNGEEYTLLSEYEKDKERLGGIDAVQIFDWAYTEEGGRVGSYMPWEELRNTEALAGQLAELRRRGTVSLCYVDAYFSRKGSPLAEVFGEAMTVKDKSGEPYYQLGEDHWVICPYNGEWRSFLSRAVCEAHARLGFDGVYVDQVGYGTHYTCYDKSHRHPLPSLQNAGERMLVEEISLAVGLPAAVEYFPADELLDTCCAALTDNDNYTVISRFVHPEIKQFKVISCDEPIGDNISAVERAFFNGLGLWLDGDSASDRWYSPRVRRTVEKHYKIMKDYAEAFESDNVIPLIGTLCESLISHMFRGEDKAVFTVFNRGASDFDGAAIPIGEFALGGYGFFDIYNGGGEIFPVMTEVGPALPIRLPRGSVGAIGAVKRK